LINFYFYLWFWIFMKQCHKDWQITLHWHVNTGNNLRWWINWM
jgi:hypothetical protein